MHGSTADALTVDAAVRRAAVAAAGLTVAGGLTLGMFFAIGEPWSTVNDVTAIALAVATVSIARGLARGDGRRITRAGVLADLAGVAVFVLATALLVARVVTFEASLPYVLVGQALIGVWLLLAGVSLRRRLRSTLIPGLAIAGGAGLVVSLLGFARGGMRDPLAAVGWGVALVGTVGFYGLLGISGRR